MSRNIHTTELGCPPGDTKHVTCTFLSQRVVITTNGLRLGSRFVAEQAKVHHAIVEVRLFLVHIL